MYLVNPIVGNYVVLRSCTVEDAEFTRNIRINPKVNKFFPRLNNTLEEQRNWISAQQAKSGDYFFVVEDKENNKIGTIGLYNIVGEKAESGRIIMLGNPVQSIEAQFLILEFAFYTLGILVVSSFIFGDNAAAIRFTKFFGGDCSLPRKFDDNRQVVDAVITKKHFENRKKIIEKIINK